MTDPNLDPYTASDADARARSERAEAEIRRQTAIANRAAADLRLANAAAAANEEHRLRAIENSRIDDANLAAAEARGYASNAYLENEGLRDRLITERAVASQANFGMTLMVCVALGAMLIVGVWYFTSASSTTNVATYPTPHAAATTVVAPASQTQAQPIVITPPPAIQSPVIVKTAPPPAPAARRAPTTGSRVDNPPVASAPSENDGADNAGNVTTPNSTDGTTSDNVTR